MENSNPLTTHNWFQNKYKIKSPIGWYYTEVYLNVINMPKLYTLIKQRWDKQEVRSASLVLSSFLETLHLCPLYLLMV